MNVLDAARTFLPLYFDGKLNSATFAQSLRGFPKNSILRSDLVHFLSRNSMPLSIASHIGNLVYDVKETPVEDSGPFYNNPKYIIYSNEDLNLDYCNTCMAQGKTQNVQLTRIKLPYKRNAKIYSSWEPIVKHFKCDGCGYTFEQIYDAPVPTPFPTRPSTPGWYLGMRVPGPVFSKSENPYTHFTSSLAR